jgi:murein DD-endopeptidase MepM/ murein hydrolase activator NlpD
MRLAVDEGPRVSTEMLGPPVVPRRRRNARRASLARAGLAQVRGVAPAVAASDSDAPGGHIAALALALRLPGPRQRSHGLLLIVAGLVLVAELLGAISTRVQSQPARPSAEAAAPADATAFSPVAGSPLAIGPIRLDPSALPLAPAVSQPREVSSAFRATHQLGESETLGAVAARYDLPLEALIWANGLEQGDALVAGQLLRVPHVPGLPYTVGQGDSPAALAERFGVPLEAIVSFPPNQLDGDEPLAAGREIFIPGAALQLPSDLLAAAGGLEGLAARRAEQAATVRAEQTNIRTGPSTEHPRLAQLDAGRRVALRARNEQWLLVELGAIRGWVRADMVEVDQALVEALPVSADFPAPPPRWAWPARGTLTSGFGPRWRSFHNGIDIANRAWTPIVAARTGVVKEAGWCSGYGYCVRLRHDDGLETIYGHLIDRPVVSRGDEVQVGELIGHMGSTYDRAGGGYSTGVHLHFTVLLNGKAVNPLRFLP